MKIEIVPIGKYKFIIFNDKYVSCENNCHTDDVIRENLLDNYNTLLKRYKNPDRSFIQFKRRAIAQRRPDWAGYKYKPEKVSLLEDMGYKAKLPLIDGMGQPVELEMHYWDETKEGTRYGVFVFGRHSGTIVHDTEETLKDFFDRLIGEVCYFTTVQTVNYFPFVKEVRSQFNHYPALHVIRLA